MRAPMSVSGAEASIMRGRKTGTSIRRTREDRTVLPSWMTNASAPSMAYAERLVMRNGRSSVLASSPKDTSLPMFQAASSPVSVMTAALDAVDTSVLPSSSWSQKSGPVLLMAFLHLALLTSGGGIPFLETFLRGFGTGILSFLKNLIPQPSLTPLAIMEHRSVL